MYDCITKRTFSQSAKLILKNKKYCLSVILKSLEKLKEFSGVNLVVTLSRQENLPSWGNFTKGRVTQGLIKEVLKHGRKGNLMMRLYQ